MKKLNLRERLDDFKVERKKITAKITARKILRKKSQVNSILKRISGVPYGFEKIDFKTFKKARNQVKSLLLKSNYNR